MADTIEKIYCCDKNDNNDALTAAILAGRNNDNGYAAMLANGANNWMNNPFAYLMFLAFARNGGFGFDGNGNAYNNTALEAIRTQMQDNQNSSLIMSAIGDGSNRNDFALSQLAQNLNVDFNTLQKCCCDVQAAIQAVCGETKFSAERVINAANLGDLNIIQNLKDCCCTTQKDILKLGADLQLQNCKDTAELRNGQRDLGVALAQGFSATAYETQKQTCEIINAGNANTQRIVDTLNNHWSAEDKLKIQDLKNEISQLKQTQQLLAAVRNNDGCGCNGCNGSCF